MSVATTPAFFISCMVSEYPMKREESLAKPCAVACISEKSFSDVFHWTLSVFPPSRRETWGWASLEGTPPLWSTMSILLFER